MKLNVEYLIENDVVKKTYMGNDYEDLFGRARKNNLYEKCRSATFELEEVEHGNQCSKC